MEENKSGVGSIIGTIIIIALIILGGLYFWGKRIENSKGVNTSGTEETVDMTDNTEAAAIKSTSGSDELSDIEADLSNTNLDNLGAEINQ